jgi:hypothetical protein
MAYAKVKKLHHETFNVTMADVSTASSVFIAMPFRGRVVAGYLAIQNAITGSDSALTAKINGTSITGFTGTAAVSGSAAGTVFTMAEPTGANNFVDGDVLELITDGASSTTAIGTWTILVHTY